MNAVDQRAVKAAITKIRRTRGMMAKIASALGISQQAVCVWKKVPQRHLIAVEKVTGIPCEKLRPDIANWRHEYAERSNDQLPRPNRRRDDAAALGAGGGRRLSAAPLVVDNRTRRTRARKGNRTDARGGDAAGR